MYGEFEKLLLLSQLKSCLKSISETMRPFNSFELLAGRFWSSATVKLTTVSQMCVCVITVSPLITYSPFIKSVVQTVQNRGDGKARPHSLSMPEIRQVCSLCVCVCACPFVSILFAHVPMCILPGCWRVWAFRASSTNSLPLFC